MRNFASTMLMALVASTLVACGDDSSTPDAATPDASTDASGDAQTPTPVERAIALTAEGITVNITTHPYAVSVADASGTTVLSTLPNARGDGYAPIAWTSGRLSWSPGVITPGHYRFAPSLDPWREGWVTVDVREAANEVTLVMAPPDGSADRIEVTHRVRASTLRVEAKLVTEGDAPRAWEASFAAPTDEHYLGLGERFTRTDQRGLDVYSWAEEGGVGLGENRPAGIHNPSPNGEAMTYYPVPFMISTKGYGFWLDTTWRSEFNLVTAHDDAWRVWEIGPELAFEVYVPKPADARPWPYQVIDLFTEATGRPRVAPAWTYGPRRRIGRGSMQDGVPEIQAMRDRDLAITGLDDAVHFLPAGSQVGIEDTLRAWVTEGHRLGYKMNCYYNSLVSNDPDTKIPDTLAQGIDQGYFLKNAAGDLSLVELISGTFLPVLQIDFTNPDATSWYGTLLDWSTDLGYDGFMYDFGEYVQPDTLAANGMTGEELHNLYPVIYQKAAFDQLEAGALAGEWLTFARSGYTGASQYSPMVWSGDPAASFDDTDGLPSMPRAGINLGISGVPNWGGDIGGFHCVADGAMAANGELMTRWIEQGSMSPNMQDQNACSFSMDGGTKASIWSSSDAMDAWRTYARLHTRLFPYVWALAHEAHATGAPIMRHVFLEHPDRVDLAGVDDAYYYGPAILVAPVVARGDVTKTIDLPAGHYLDWQAETLVEGGSVVTLPAPLDKLPLLLRDGYLVPMLDPTIDTLASAGDASVVTPEDVADVYDVVGLLSSDTGGARFTMAEGTHLSATFSGGFVAPVGMTEATREAELSSCAAGCYMVQDLGGGLSRVRISHAGGALTTGGLALDSDVGRRVRWDLYLLEP